MTDFLIIVAVVLLITVVALLLMLLRKTSRTDATLLNSRLDAFEKAQERVERSVRDEIALSRDELGKSVREQRQELTEAFKTFGDSVVQRMMEVSNVQKGQLDAFSGQLGSFAKASGERLDGVRAETATGAKQVREEVVATLKTLSETITQTMGELASVQKGQLEAFSAQLGSFAKDSGERMDGVRAESATAGKQLREEVVTTLKSISDTMSETMKNLSAAEKTQLEAFSGQIASLTKTSGEKLDGIRTESATGAKQLREEVIAALKGITEATMRTMGELANVQKAQLESMSAAIGKLSDSNENKLEAVRVTLEGKLQSMQTDNAKQLEQMRQTVDEKLQGTLEKRLGESFKQVSERLEQVHKGLGEMQTLATGGGRPQKSTHERQDPWDVGRSTAWDNVGADTQSRSIRNQCGYEGRRRARGVCYQVAWTRATQRGHRLAAD